MTPFSTALNVAGKSSTTNAVLSNPRVQPKVVAQMAVLPKKPKSSVVTKQVGDYAKAMQLAIKNTKSY